MLRKDKVLLSLHKLCENMTLKDLQSDKIRIHYNRNC